MKVLLKIKVAGKATEGEEHRDHWSEDSHVFFTGGVGYGLTRELQTIPLSSEADILEAFKSGKLPDHLTPVQRGVLESVLEFRREVLTDARTVEVKRPSVIRSRPAGTVERRAANVRQAKARKKLSVHKAKR